VLDAGALIALDRADERVRALLALALRSEARIVLPAGVIGQVWRDGARQVRLARFLSDPYLTVDVLDAEESRACGVLCGRTRHPDVIDASVVVSARRHQAVVVTSDPKDIRRLSADVVIHSI
jgi:hypothetical protein